MSLRKYRKLRKLGFHLKEGYYTKEAAEDAAKYLVRRGETYEVRVAKVRGEWLIMCRGRRR